MVTDPFLKETYNKAFDYLRKEPGKEIHAFLLFRELARLQPEYWRIHIFQGEALCELGRYQDAIFATQLAQDRAPYKKFSITVLREAQIHRLYLHRTLADEIFDWAIKSDESPPAFYWILKGANLARWGKFTEALECHRKALGPEATEKYSDEAHLNIGYILRSQEKFDEARSHFQKALDIDPEYKVAKEALAELDGIEETLELVQRVEAISNQSTEHMDEEGIGVFLDDVFYRMEELREEGKTIQEIILTRANLILRSNSWDTRILFGDSLRRVGLNDEANRQLRWALKDADKDKMSAICYQLGLLHSDSSSPEEGEEWFRRGTEEFQTPFCNLWVERGINLIRLSDFEKARECFEKALACGERDHELSDAYFQLGKLARCFEEFDDAKKFFNKAKKLYPNNKEACIALNGLEGLDETLALCKRLRAMGV